MSLFLQAIPFSFAALFPVLNPVGSAVIILSIVGNLDKAEMNLLASKIALYAFILLIVSLFAGSWILRLFGISIPVILIGGGLVIAGIGWQMLNQKVDPGEKTLTPDEASRTIQTMAFYPLTLPVTAGPGCIAVAITLGAHGQRSSWQETLITQAGDATGILLSALTIYLCYRYARVITARLGKTGTSVIMRLAAFFNLCIGLELMEHGLLAIHY